MGCNSLALHVCCLSADEMPSSPSAEYNDGQRPDGLEEVAQVGLIVEQEGTTKQGSEGSQEEDQADVGVQKMVLESKQKRKLEVVGTREKRMRSS